MRKSADDLAVLSERKTLTRRQLMQGLVAGLMHAAVATRARASAAPVEPIFRGGVVNHFERQMAPQTNREQHRSGL